MSPFTRPLGCKALQSELLRPVAAADLLGVTVDTLQHWRRGKQPRNGLRYQRIGGKVFYTRADVLAFAEARRAVQLEPLRRAA